MLDNNKREILQRIDGLSELQRIEYRGRLDICYAVITFIQGSVEERQRQAELIEEQSAMLRAKWPWVLFGVGLVLAWVGKEMDLPTVTIGYILMWATVLRFIQAAINDWKMRCRIQEIE